MSIERLKDLFATRDSSLALAVAALAHVADDQGRAPFGDLAVAYRDEFLKLPEHRVQPGGGDRGPVQGEMGDGADGVGSRPGLPGDRGRSGVNHRERPFQRAREPPAAAVAAAELARGGGWV